MLTPGGAHAYVINHCSLPLIDTAIDESPRIVVGDLPRCVPISPDGKRAYVSGFGDMRCRLSTRLPIASRTPWMSAVVPKDWQSVPTATTSIVSD